MSMVSFAVRQVFVNLLKGQTWAGDLIIDSPIDPVQEVMGLSENKGKIVLAVYSGAVEPESSERQILGGANDLDIMVYRFLPPAVTKVGEDEIEVHVRGAGGPMALDFIGRQIDVALTAGPQPWKGLLDTFILKFGQVKTRAVLYPINEGLSLPAIETIYSVSTVPEPNIGEPLYGAWSGLYDAMVADADMAPIADLFKASIELPSGMPDWRLAQIAMGWSDDAARAMGITPQDETETGDPAVVSNITTTVEHGAP